MKEVSKILLLRMKISAPLLAAIVCLTSEFWLRCVLSENNGGHISFRWSWWCWWSIFIQCIEEVGSNLVQNLLWPRRWEFFWSDLFTRPFKLLGQRQGKSSSYWFACCFAVPEATQEVVRRVSGAFSRSGLGEKVIDTFDVLVCGGTLGVFIATALSLKGLRVGIVERNVLKGVNILDNGVYPRFCERTINQYYKWEKVCFQNKKTRKDLTNDSFLLVVMGQREQEWNISRKELMELVEVGVLAEDDIEQATAMKFNPVSFRI